MPQKTKPKELSLSLTQALEIKGSPTPLMLIDEIARRQGFILTEDQKRFLGQTIHVCSDQWRDANITSLTFPDSELQKPF